MRQEEPPEVSVRLPCGANRDIVTCVVLLGEYGDQCLSQKRLPAPGDDCSLPGSAISAGIKRAISFDLPQTERFSCLARPTSRRLMTLSTGKHRHMQTLAPRPVCTKMVR